MERSDKAMAVVDTREPPYHAVMVTGDAEIGPALSREEEYEIALRSRWIGLCGGPEADLVL